MNRLSRDKQIQVVTALVEGNSIRATVRMTGVAKNTVTKLLVDLGVACEVWHDANVKNLKCERIQCDEIWSFVQKKDKNRSIEERSKIGVGSVWTWTAIDADTKLAVSWLVGGRDGQYAYLFMQDIADRLTNRVQLTTDSHKSYLTAVRGAFNNEIDYAMLVKKYGNAPQGPETRYSPAECVGIEKIAITGEPDMKHVSTSYVERQNLTMRMSMRRFTRLTNGFSKKMENLQAAVALHFMHYNFVRMHQTLRCTPAMAAGLAKRPWNIGDLVDLLPD